MNLFLSRIGGKQRLAKDIIRLFPNHYTYVEPFGGGAAVLLNKQPSTVEVYNDIDGNLVNLFQVVKDQDKFQAFLKLYQLTLYARGEFDHAKALLSGEQELTSVERAFCSFVVNKMCFGGKDSIADAHFGFPIKSMENVIAWDNVEPYLLRAHKRLRRVLVEHLEYKELIKRFAGAETLFYCDPPYVQEVRRAGAKYLFELDDEEHGLFVQLVMETEGLFVVSGYPNTVYEKLEANGWETRDFQAYCSVIGATEKTKELKGKERTERVWLSPSVVKGLQKRRRFRSIKEHCIAT